MDDHELLCVLKTLLLTLKGVERINRALEHIGPHITAEIHKRGLDAKAEQLAHDLDLELGIEPSSN